MEPLPFAPQGVPRLRNRWFYNSYDLNLVNHRGGRLNLIDHAHLSGLRQGADQLALFLNVPFWDGVYDHGETMSDLKMKVLRSIV